MLAGFDASGRLRTLTGPHLDYPQHLRWSRLGFRHPARNGGGWLNGAGWRHEQEYLPGTNVLVTRSRRQRSGLQIEQRAACIDGVLAIGIELTSGRPGILQWELGLQVGGQPLANAAQYFPELDIVLARHREAALAIAAAPGALQFRGRADRGAGWAASRRGEQRFAVVGEVILQLDVPLAGGQPSVLLIAIGAPSQLPEPLVALRDRVAASRAWPLELSLSVADPPPAMRALGALEAAAGDGYLRSLLTIGQLTDRSGALLAGPPIDARFEHSGGYAYCWPRDGAFIAHALDIVGHHDAARAFFTWSLTHQPEDGIWKQRYYADGLLAPCWADHQLDETGTLLWALDHHLRLAPDPRLLELGARAALRAYARITELAAASGWPPVTENLWEDQEGAHAYTLAALLAGAQAWLWRARSRQDSAAVALLELVVERLQDALASWPVDPGTGALARAIVRTDGTRQPDFTPDASLLGLSVPFEVLQPQDPRLSDTVGILMRTLLTPQGRMRRYQKDHYRGGNPWPLCSLWLAWHHLRAGRPAEALRLYRRVLNDRTPAGLLAEQVDPRTGQALWVVPLPWAHAWFLLVTHALAKSRPNSSRGSNRTPVQSG